MKLKAFGEVLDLRPEIMEPKGLVDMIDLGALTGNGRRGLGARGPGLDTLRDPKAFFNITYPTTEIVETLKTLAKRAANPEQVPGTILLSGRYGQGKSHVLLAAHHALNAPDVAREWATQWRLGPLELPRDALVVTRSFIQHADEPLWDMLLSALSPGRKPKVNDFPDGERIESLLGDKPVFLIMDELERWYDAQDERSRSRNRNFIQALTEVTMRDGRITLLTSVLGERQEPAETIRRVKPLELSFRSAEDRQRVVLFRLFSNRNTQEAESAAKRVAAEYSAAYTAAGVRRVDDLQARMISTWPLAPEFLDILTKKVPNLGGFQNTRGTLRFLAHVVRHNHRNRPLVSSQDLPFHDDVIFQALLNLDTSGGEVVRRALGDNYEAVSDKLVHRDELFSTLVFYSIADPTHPGATLDELLIATLDPGENPLRIRDNLAELKTHAFNLHERDERYVFLAVENPHARITAMASSQLVTREATRNHILLALAQAWGGQERTVVFAPDGWTELADGLKAVRNQRPRIILSTQALSPKERLRLQNVDEERNLVLLVEPHVRTSREDTTYSLLTDDALVLHARRIEACKLLLGGNPANDAAGVYRRVYDDELKRLKKEVIERYGVTILWNRAGASQTQDVDESWFEVYRLDTPTAEGLLSTWRNELTGRPEIKGEVAKRWPEYRTRAVAELVHTFERTPGLPVPLERDWVSAVVRQLVEENVFGLVDFGGSPVSGKQVGRMGDAELLGCLISPPGSTVTINPEPQVAARHPGAAAHYDASRRGVVVAWSYPPAPGPGESYRTLIQRYGSSRHWVEGQSYEIDPGETHEANRYFGNDDEFFDTERLQPGEWYHYYVFLVHHRDNRPTIYTLSRRCDVGVPRKSDRPKGVLETSKHPSPSKLSIEVEGLVMSGKHMTSESQVRKIEFRVDGASGPELTNQLGQGLSAKFGNNLELSASLSFVVRGAYNRQEVVAAVRMLPRFEGARYSAALHLKTDGTDSGEEG